MHTIYLPIAGLCLICLGVRTSYELLKKNGRVDTENKAVFTVVFVAMCLMLGSWPAMGPNDPVRLVVPAFVRLSGFGLVAAGLMLAVGGLVQLRGLENIDHLVTSGLYSRLRHPMYSGFVLWIVGWSLAFGGVVTLAVGTLCIANILYWRSLEEVAMQARFGEAYRAYRKGTWF